MKDFNRVGIEKIKVEKDFKVPDSAGAGGMFQIVSIEIEYENGDKCNLQNYVDCGVMFHDNHELLRYLNLDDSAEIEEV